MRKFTAIVVVAFFLGVFAHDMWAEDEKPKEEAKKEMTLGAFSISLNVKDIKKSKEFYEKLGFKAAGGNMEQRWLILRNGSTVIGLFQGMFPKNMLTFNPGWNQQAKPVKEFLDIREIQKRLQAGGVALTMKCDPASTGPAHVVLADPDGNPILIDQHVAKPGAKAKAGK